MRQAISKVKHHAKKIGQHLLDHVVPHPGNNHQPHLLKHRVLFGYSMFLVLLKLVAILAPIVLPSSSLYSSAITPGNIIDLTNQTRQNLNLGDLKVNDALSEAAQAKAEDMLANQYFAHTSPAGITPWGWMAKVKYHYQFAGENLAVNFTSAEGVQEGWMASPSHRANIVNPRYADIGVGVVTGQFEGYESAIVVQMFGLPAIGTTEAPVSVATTVPEPIVKPATQVVLALSVPKSAVVIPPVAPVVIPVPTATPPKVEPSPVAVLPQAAPQPETKGTEQATLPAVLIPQVDESSLKVEPGEGYYTISLSVTNAQSVSAHLGNQWASLELVPTTAKWTGRVSYDSMVLDRSGEQLSVVAWGSDGTTVSQGLVWLAPQVKTQQLYTFNEGSDRYAKLFGFLTVHNLNDSVRKFYFAFALFLSAALLINILVKIRIQRLSVINHTMLVMALALLLVII